MLPATARWAIWIACARQWFLESRALRHAARVSPDGGDARAAMVEPADAVRDAAQSTHGAGRAMMTAPTPQGLAEAPRRWLVDAEVVGEQLYRAPTPRERERWPAVWLARHGLSAGT